MKGKLYLSYFAKLKQGKGRKISIAQFNPKWLKEGDIDEHLKELAPSKDLLIDYKYRGLTWDKYTERYLKQLSSFYRYKNDQLQTRSDLDKLLEYLDNGEDITLYCFEKSDEQCHRYILADVIKRFGYEVEEI
ncbi:TPA: DUF488 family protein [Clostridium perfringens]